MAPIKISSFIAFLSAVCSFMYCCPTVHASYYGSGGGFVSTQGSKFTVNGHPLYVNGFNAYYLADLAVDSRPKVSQILQEAAAAGLTVCRTWAFNDGSYHAIQVSPGQYDEGVFQALDFVLQEAGNSGIRLILSLVDNYPNMGGRQQYVQWARNAGQSCSSEDEFYTNPTIKGYFKNYIQTVLTRINTLTGVAYKDDPTVFAWELMNEPRCPSDPSGDTLYGWIDEMAAYVKSIDGNHLVEAGLEGFYGPSTPDKQHFNPWGDSMGTDYVRFSKIWAVDFTTVHSYPDVWMAGSSFEGQLEFLREWVGSHAQQATADVQKPVLFAEFGLSRADGGYSDANRQALFSALYGAVYESAASGGPAAGALFWQLCPADLQPSLATDGYAVDLSPGPTTALISLQSQRLSALNQ